MPNDYGPIRVLPSMSEPILSWSMQSGGYIFMRQGENRIRIDPDDMARLLMSHSNEHYIQRVVSDDEGDGEHLEPITAWSSSVPSKESE